MYTPSLRSLSLALGLATMAFRPSAAQQNLALQMNYYKDQQCTQYGAQVTLDPSSIGKCMNYDVPGMGSFNVADCYTGKEYTGCHCTWYSEQGCVGGFSVSAGMLTNGAALNAMMTDKSQLTMGNCGQTSISFQEPKSFICHTGFYIN